MAVAMAEPQMLNWDYSQAITPSEVGQSLQYSQHRQLLPVKLRKITATELLLKKIATTAMLINIFLSLMLSENLAF